MAIPFTLNASNRSQEECSRLGICVKVHREKTSVLDTTQYDQENELCAKGIVVCCIYDSFEFLLIYDGIAVKERNVHETINVLPCLAKTT